MLAALLAASGTSQAYASHDLGSAQMAPKAVQACDSPKVFTMSSDYPGTVTFRTGAVASADLYQYELADTPAFGQGRKTITTSSRTSVYVCAPEARVYYGRARACRIEGGKKVWGAWSRTKRVGTRPFVFANPGSISKFVGGWMLASGAKVVHIDDKEVDTGEFDGLLLPGGGADVNPALYGEEASDRVGEIDNETDELHMAAFYAFKRAEKPILGICRGLQVINVCLGGSLEQHIPGRHWGNRPIAIERGSWLDGMFERSETVYHYHHQCIDELGEGLVVTQRDRIDNRIEAIEHETLPIFGLQWHPDSMGKRGRDVAKAFMFECSRRYALQAQNAAM